MDELTDGIFRQLPSFYLDAELHFRESLSDLQVRENLKSELAYKSSRMNPRYMLDWSTLRIRRTDRVGSVSTYLGEVIVYQAPQVVLRNRRKWYL